MDSTFCGPSSGKGPSCADCHGDKGRLDWKALGYPGDPRKKK